MTNNPTIDGVSRELLQRWLDNAEFFNHLDGMSMASIDAARKEDDKILEELRALLDAPVVERQPDLVECDACPTSGGCVRTCMKADRVSPAAGEVEVLATVTEGGDLIRNGVLRAVELVDRKHLARLQTEVAALQSTIAQLQARIAELESGRGEPVANCFERRNGAGEWVNDTKTWADGVPCAEILNECKKYPDLYRIRLAYTAPPAPVAVVLPDFDTWYAKNVGVIGTESYKRDRRVWSACLDATAALNGVKS